MANKFHLLSQLQLIGVLCQKIARLCQAWVKLCFWTSKYLTSLTFLQKVVFLFLTICSSLSQNGKSTSSSSNFKAYDQSSHMIRTVQNCPSTSWYHASFQSQRYLWDSEVWIPVHDHKQQRTHKVQKNNNNWSDCVPNPEIDTLIYIILFNSPNKCIKLIFIPRF